MARLISKDSLRAEQLLKLAGTSHKAQYTIDGEISSMDIPRLPSGELNRMLLTRPVGEFLGSSDMLAELAQKVTVDVELGRDEVPLLYKPLYRQFVNPNFPRLLDANQILYANVVFLQHFEGQEVRFGTMASETGVTVPILTYSAGFEWDEDVEVYDEGWRVEMANEAVGRAYNALLNHLHLSPILTYNYAGMTNPNTTAAQTPTGNLIEDTRATLRKALSDAAVNVDLNGVKKPIRPTYILCDSADALTINDALSLADRPSIGTTAASGPIDVLLGRVTDTAGPVPSVNQLQTIIAYDGESLEMGNLTFSYAAPTNGVAYLVQPGRNMFEFIKHDLRVDTERPADLSRLVAAQMVARARRGLLMSPELSVWEVTLP
jgi:hypothetical protein